MIKYQLIGISHNAHAIQSHPFNTNVLAEQLNANF